MFQSEDEFLLFKVATIATLTNVCHLRTKNVGVGSFQGLTIENVKIVASIEVSWFYLLYVVIFYLFHSVQCKCT